MLAIFGLVIAVLFKIYPQSVIPIWIEIPVAMLIGWLVFHDLPNGMAALGILVTIAAGLSIILFERRRQQMA